ncbi:MAG: ATP-binding cassette domain-containing protein [Bacilli bacterium]|nr:ATP-binding cassette domain-containing protein [Bacilli bacterium]
MIELKNVTKIFNMTGNALDERKALDNVNLTIEDGEFVTIIGGNGSGKTTSLNIMCGSIIPDSGQVILSGMDITHMKEHQRAKYFGRVFQDPHMGTTANMSCLENLEIAFRRGKARLPFKWGFSNNTVKLLFKRQLAEFHLGLEDRLNQKVGVMSGGQRQALTLIMAAEDTRLDTKKEFIDMYIDVQTGPLRIELANANKQDKKEIKQRLKEKRLECKNIAGNFYDEKFEEYKKKIEGANDEEKVDAYIELSNTFHNFNQDRKILLLDEHTAALDPKTSKKVLNLTEKIVKEKGLTTLMITHNMKDALTYGDRLVMFYQGHIIKDVKGKEKAKLKVEDLLRIFDEADAVE